MICGTLGAYRVDERVVQKSLQRDPLQDELVSLTDSLSFCRDLVRF
jgi:hypothetical protein